MALAVKVSLIVVGTTNYVSSDKTHTVVMIDHDILPDGKTLPRDFRYSFNHYTTEHNDLVFGLFLGDDDLSEDDDFINLGLSLEEAKELNKKLESRGIEIGVCGITTLEGWAEIAKRENAGERFSYTELLELYASYHDYIEDRKVLVFVENDQFK